MAALQDGVSVYNLSTLKFIIGQEKNGNADGLSRTTNPQASPEKVGGDVRDAPLH